LQARIEGCTLGFVIAEISGKCTAARDDSKAEKLAETAGESAPVTRTGFAGLGQASVKHSAPAESLKEQP
jgi:hypothetical protein